MCEWKVSTFASRPPVSDPTFVDGNYLSRGRGIHRRISYHKDFGATEWAGVSASLIDYFEKIAEVLPQFYAGHGIPDPFAGQPTTEVGEDNGWDRIVLLRDPVYGKFVTHLWRGSEEPKHCDRVWVICRFPFIDETFMAAPEDDDSVGEMLKRRMKECLIEATESERGQTALQSLHAWRDFEWWTMEYENRKTLERLVLSS